MRRFNRIKVLWRSFWHASLMPKYKSGVAYVPSLRAMEACKTREELLKLLDIEDTPELHQIEDEMKRKFSF